MSRHKSRHIANLFLTFDEDVIHKDLPLFGIDQVCPVQKIPAPPALRAAAGMGQTLSRLSETKFASRSWINSTNEQAKYEYWDKLPDLVKDQVLAELSLKERVKAEIVCRDFHRRLRRPALTPSNCPQDAWPQTHGIPFLSAASRLVMRKSWVRFATWRRAEWC